MSNNTTIASFEMLEGRTLRSAAPVPAGFNYDLDRSGAVDCDDLFVVDSHNVKGNHNAGWANGDVDGNGTVNRLDQQLEEAAVEFAQSGQMADGDQSLTPLLGDADGDGEITGDDLTAGYSYGLKKTWSDGDFNGDGKVDVTDSIIVETSYKVTHGEIDSISGDEWHDIDTVRATLSEADGNFLGGI